MAGTQKAHIAYSDNYIMNTKLIALGLTLVAVGGVTMGTVTIGTAQEAGNAGNQPGGPGAGNQPTAFTVPDLTAPDSVAPGDTVEVAATVTNPTNATRTESVAFRIGGSVADRALVTLDPGETTTVQFSASTAGLAPGTYTHGVFAAENGQVAEITVADSYTLDALDAPPNATVGDSVTVNATVSNPNDFATSQAVEFRLGGTLVEAQSVDLDAGASTTVTFVLPTAGVEPGDYVHSVFTRDDGQFARLTLTPAPPDQASVTFDNQTSDGTTVTVERVALPEDGYVAMHNDSLFDGDVVGSVIGVSDYLEAGVHENVTVTLFDVPGAAFADDELNETGTLVAMPHVETGDNETYDFVRTNGTEDGPFTVDGEAVVDSGVVTVTDEDDGTEAPPETPDTPDETETPADDSNETDTPA